MWQVLVGYNNIWVQVIVTLYIQHLGTFFLSIGERVLKLSLHQLTVISLRSTASGQAF